MPRPTALLAREAAAHRAVMLAAIGRRLRDEYDATQPLPDELSDLVARIAQAETDTT